jgi:hypothetical protein
MRLVLVGGAVLLALAGCANEYHPEYHPESTYSYEQNVSYPTVFQVGGEASATGTASAAAPAAAGNPSNVLVLQSTHLDRPAEVVGVIDAHLPMGSHDAALDVLRRRAASMGADAVVGVEFHHGEGEGQPTHLSGLAVRFIPKVPYPIDR